MSLSKLLERLLRRREDELEKQLREMRRLARAAVDEQERILKKKRKPTGWLAALEEEESVFPEELYGAR
jgi:hypothetical protein